MELGEPDERGRRRPVEVPDSEFTLDVDTVIMSIGTSPNPLIKSTTAGLEVNRWGGIIVTEDGATTKEGVYDFRFPRQWIVYHEALQYFSV